MSANKLSNTQRDALSATSQCEDGPMNAAPDKLPHGRDAANRLKTKVEAPQRSGKSGQAISKQARVIEILSHQHGATIAAIMKATGWQQHSVRGFFAGVVRSKFRLNLVSEKTGEQRVFRIVAKSAAAPRKRKLARKAA